MSQRPNSRTSQRIHKYPRIHKYCTFEYSSLCLALCLFNIFHSLVDIYNNRELYLAWNAHTPTGGDRLAYITGQKQPIKSSFASLWATRTASGPEGHLFFTSCSPGASLGFRLCCALFPPSFLLSRRWMHVLCAL